VNNDEVAEALRDLRERSASGGSDIDDTYAEFERLTFLLTNLRQGDDRRLTALTNEIELIRFGETPERQASALDEVLGRAQVLFDELR
jgi:hypothetical protein